MFEENQIDAKNLHKKDRVDQCKQSFAEVNLGTNFLPEYYTFRQSSEAIAE